MNGSHNSLQAGFFNWNSKNFYGLQAAFVNTVGGDFGGLQAGFVNTNAGNFVGLQAGFINTNTGKSSGLQAGFVNTNAGDSRSFQAGFLNTVAGNMTGFQAGFVNTNAGNFNGFQAGFVNTNAGLTNGPQIGFVNIANNNMIGTQLGFFNIARSGIKGAQIGFINYAESIEGIPFGFISIVKQGGYRAIEYSSSEFFTHNAGLKFGVEKFYTAMYIAYNHTNEFSWENFAAGFGIGSKLSGRFLFFNPELIGLSSIQTRTANRWSEGSVNYNSFITYFGINLGNLSIAVGPSVTWVYSGNLGRSPWKFSGSAGREANDKPEVPSPKFSLHTHDFNDNHSIVVGARAAVRIRF
jgi:hypothetical protein